MPCQLDKTPITWRVIQHWLEYMSCVAFILVTVVMSSIVRVIPWLSVGDFTVVEVGYLRHYYTLFYPHVHTPISMISVYLSSLALELIIRLMGASFMSILMPTNFLWVTFTRPRQASNWVENIHCELPPTLYGLNVHNIAVWVWLCWWLTGCLLCYTAHLEALFSCPRLSLTLVSLLLVSLLLVPLFYVRYESLLSLISYMPYPLRLWQMLISKLWICSIRRGQTANGPDTQKR